MRPKDEDYLTKIAWTTWEAHLSRYGSNFALLVARMDLPVQTTPFEDEPDVVLRLCADLPIEIKHPIKMEATCWGLFLRRREKDWTVIAIVPMFSKGPLEVYVDGGHYPDEVIRRAA